MLAIEFIIETALFLLFAVPAILLDVRKFRIPFTYVCFGIFVFFMFRTFVVIADDFTSQLIRIRSFSDAQFLKNIGFIFLGMASSFLLFFSARIFTDGGLGKGDILFAVLTSLYCQFFLNLIAAGCAACCGMVYYLGLAAVSKFKKNEFIIKPVFAIPFVPFIAFGAVLTKILVSG